MKKITPEIKEGIKKQFCNIIDRLSENDEFGRLGFCDLLKKPDYELGYWLFEPGNKTTVLIIKENKDTSEFEKDGYVYDDNIHNEHCDLAHSFVDECIKADSKQEV